MENCTIGVVYPFSANPMNLIKTQIPRVGSVQYPINLFLFGDKWSLRFLCADFGWRTFLFWEENKMEEKERLYKHLEKLKRELLLVLIGVPVIYAIFCFGIDNNITPMDILLPVILIASAIVRYIFSQRAAKIRLIKLGETPDDISRKTKTKIDFIGKIEVKKSVKKSVTSKGSSKTLIMLFGAFGGVFVINKNKKAELALEGCRVDGDTLYIDKQSPYFFHAFSCKPYYKTLYSDNPVKLHIGSATVGGITTGGAYTTGGGIATKQVKTDRYKLVYEQFLNGFTYAKNEVTTIELTDELVKIAKDSPVNKYLHGNQISVVDTPSHSDTTRNLYSIGHQSAAFSHHADTIAHSYPNAEKIDIIVNWLCGE